MNLEQFIRKTCQNKRRYDTRGEALGAKAQIERNQKIVVNVYKCQFCGVYHVGRASETEQEAVKEPRKSSQNRKQKYDKRERRTGRLANYAAHKLGGDCSPSEIEEIADELASKKH